MKIGCNAALIICRALSVEWVWLFLKCGNFFTGFIIGFFVKRLYKCEERFILLCKLLIVGFYIFWHFRDNLINLIESLSG